MSQIPDGQQAVGTFIAKIPTVCSLGDIRELDNISAGVVCTPKDFTSRPESYRLQGEPRLNASNETFFLYHIIHVWS